MTPHVRPARRRQANQTDALEGHRCSNPRSMTSHASAVTRTTTVNTRLSSSTSAGYSRSPSDGRRGSDASQRRRSRSARSGSMSSPLRCTLGCPSRPMPHRPPGALGIDRSSELSGEVACERRHPGLHVVVLFDLRRLTWRTNEARTRRSDVAGGSTRSVSASSPPRCALRHLRELHRVLDRVRLGAIEARSPADEVACERHHRNRPCRHLVVLFDLHRDHPEGHRSSDASQRRRRRRSCAISVSSSSRCALGSSPGTAPRRTRSAYRDV